jgi:orotate phosphoribosyltransferase
VAIVEDVVTHGGSTIDAIGKCQREGHTIVQVLALVDREQGGLERIRNEMRAGVPIVALFTKSELHTLWQTRHPSKVAS